MLRSQLSGLEPLAFPDGEAVRDPADWPRRRVQLQGVFEEVMYGPWPGSVSAQDMDVSLIYRDPRALNGTATLAEFAVRIDEPACRLRLLTVTPNTPGPHPCFLGANFHGNHTVIDHPGVAVHDRWSTAGTGLSRGYQQDRWDFRGMVAAGYAVATFFCGDIVQDRPELANDDLEPFTRSGKRPGALMAWAWGLAAARTALSGRTGIGIDIDIDRLVVVGHSRLGKAALLAGGWDAGFAAVIAAQSGTAGAAPSRKAPRRRGPDGQDQPAVETIERGTEAFPYWYSPTLRTYAHRVEELPIDQHELLALCAPVPTLIWVGAEDGWSDPEGTFETVRAAAGVFRFLGADQPALPASAIGAISSGTLAYGLRSGGHTVTAADWAAWRQWCDRQLRPVP